MEKNSLFTIGENVVRFYYFSVFDSDSGEVDSCSDEFDISEYNRGIAALENIGFCCIKGKYGDTIHLKKKSPEDVCLLVNRPYNSLEMTISASDLLILPKDKVINLKTEIRLCTSYDTARLY